MFTEKEIQHSKGWILSIYSIKKTFDRWAENNLKDLWNDKYHPFYLHILLLIENEAKSNNDLAKACGVSKQAMSKIVLHLVELDMIQSIPSVNDRRSSELVLTAQGKLTLAETMLRFNKLISAYQAMNGDSTINASESTLNLAQLFISKNQI